MHWVELTKVSVNSVHPLAPRSCKVCHNVTLKQEIWQFANFQSLHYTVRRHVSQVGCKCSRF